jgi:hypothetical protein
MNRKVTGVSFCYYYKIIWIWTTTRKIKGDAK